MRTAKRTTPEPTIAWCPAQLVSIDEMLDDGRTRWGGKTLDEVRTEYPGAELITISEAHRRTNDKHREAPFRMTGERWDWLLNCLPPEQWTRRADAESFKVSELICADIAQICVRLGNGRDGEFWGLKDHYNMPHADAVELVRSRRAAIMAENAGDVIDVIAEAIRALPAAWENTGEPAPNGADYIIRHLSRDQNFITLEALKASPERWGQYAEGLVNMLEDLQAAFPDEWFAKEHNVTPEFVERMETVRRRAQGWKDGRVEP